MDAIAGQCYAQNEPQRKTDNPPGFWEKIKSVLHSKKNATSHVNSVTEEYPLIYDFIHQDEIQFYDSLSKLGVSNWNQYQNIITLKYRKSDHHLAPNIKVFGWHPYWMKDAYKSYNFKLLSYIAWFSYNIDPNTGNFDNPDVINAWKNAGNLVDSAHAEHCKVLLTITSYTLVGNTTFLNNPDSQNRLIDSLVALLKLRSADGVDVNFENVNSGLEQKMTAFLTLLSQKLKRANPDYVLTVDLPVYDYFNTYEISKLDPFVDLFLVTGYDFNNGKSRADGPVAPLDALKGPYTIKKSVNQYLQAGLKREKLILGLPYYGTLWTSNSPNLGVWDSTLLFKEHLTYREIKKRYHLQKPNYDLENWSGNYVVFNPDSNYYEKCWFDDSLTLSRKYGWVLEQNLAGIGIWALGYDNGYNELWNLIDTMYSADTAIVYKEP